MDPLECARRGDVSYFKNAVLGDISSSRDNNGDSVFSIAAKANHVDCCKEIYDRCPSIIYRQSSDYRYTALHHAAWRGNTGLIEFLIAAAAAETPFVDVESGEIKVTHEKRLLRMLDDYGQTALATAVIKQHYEAAKLLVAADPGSDHGVNYNTDAELKCAVEMSYGKADNSSEVMIRRLLLQNQINSNYVYEALQVAVQKEELSAVIDIIKFCPQCLEKVDSEDQNILHIAAKLRQVVVLKAILRSQSISSSVLNARDKYGNTPLHLAALGENANTASCTEVLFSLPRVDKTTVNNMRQHVEDAVHDQEKRLGIRLGVNENKLKNQSDFELVVCAPIATISFTSGITVHGYISDGPNSGMATLSKKQSFMIFIIANTFAFLFSLYAVFSHFCTRHLREKKDIELQVKVATLCTLRGGSSKGLVRAQARDGFY